MISLANTGAAYGSNSAGNRLVSEGQGRATGFELMLQKKLAETVYGLASYSYSKIEHRALDRIYRRGAFDNRNVFNLVLGYRRNKSWEFSLKWRYAGGAPYTPFDRAASIATGEARLDLKRINTATYAPYHRLDLRLDHRDYFKKGTIVEYVSIENAYDRKNPWMHTWNKARQKTDFAYQTGLFIIGGISFEF